MYKYFIMNYNYRVDFSAPVIDQKKIVLGSFPSYVKNKPDTNKISYFFFSSRNKFWYWYKS